MKRHVILLLAVGMLAASSPSTAYIRDSYESRWAEVGFYKDPEAVGATFRIEVEGNSYSTGIPPAEVTGKGSAEVCFAIEHNALGRYAEACSDEVEFSLMPLESASAEGTVPVAIRNRHGIVVATENVSFQVTFTGRGNLVFPGVGAHTADGPEFGSSWYFTKPADVEGELTSPQLGTFPFTGLTGYLGWDRGETIDLLAEWDG